MHSSLILPILAVGPVLAQFPLLGMFAGTLDNSTEGKCHQLAMFQNMVDLVTDPKFSTAVSGVMGKFQTMSQAIDVVLNGLLEPLRKDQALVDGCKAIVAVDNQVFNCFTVQQYDMFNVMIGNQTMLDAMTNGDQTKQDNYKKLLAVMADNVNPIMNNATLVDFCKNNVDMRCVNQKYMVRLITLASDDGAVNTYFNNNATLVATFKDRVSKTKQGLDALKADSALQSVCGKMPNSLPVKIDALTLDSFPISPM